MHGTSEFGLLSFDAVSGVRPGCIWGMSGDSLESVVVSLSKSRVSFLLVWVYSNLFELFGAQLESI